jgi:hypothetical protein
MEFSMSHQEMKNEMEQYTDIIQQKLNIRFENLDAIYIEKDHFILSTKGNNIKHDYSIQGYQKVSSIFSSSFFFNSYSEYKNLKRIHELFYQNKIKSISFNHLSECVFLSFSYDEFPFHDKMDRPHKEIVLQNQFNCLSKNQQEQFIFKRRNKIIVEEKNGLMLIFMNRSQFLSLKYGNSKPKKWQTPSLEVYYKD